MNQSIARVVAWLRFMVSLYSMTQALMFDLDNTLYSEKTGLEFRVLERINCFVGDFLGISPAQANLRRREGVHRYGTTLEWLMFDQGFKDPETYFSFVHPEDEIDCLRPDDELASILDALPQEKIILTNSPLEHAMRVLEALGVADRFSAVYDIRFNGLVGKPHPRSYLKALEASGLEVGTTLFIDDLPRYVQGYLALGGRGVLKDEGRRYLDQGFERCESLGELAGLV